MYISKAEDLHALACAPGRLERVRQISRKSRDPYQVIVDHKSVWTSVYHRMPREGTSLSSVFARMARAKNQENSQSGAPAVSLVPDFFRLAFGIEEIR
jgi:hypothetical protein